MGPVELFVSEYQEGKSDREREATVEGRNDGWEGRRVKERWSKRAMGGNLRHDAWELLQESEVPLKREDIVSILPKKSPE